MELYASNEPRLSDNPRLVSITDAAMNKIYECLFADSSYFALVIGTKQGGCSGHKYTMSIIMLAAYGNPADFHIICQIDRNGVEKMVLVRNDSLMFLAGMVIDYIESETGGGFLFSNPNATSSCGCGESFSVGGAADDKLL